MSGPRVLHYRASFLPPSQTFIRSLLAHHQRYEARVLTHERVGDATDDPVPVDVIPEPPDPLRRLARRHLWSMRLPQRCTLLRRTLRAERPALVHGHFGEDAVVATAAAARLGIPSVAAFYGYDATVLARSALWRRRFRRLFRVADAVLAEGPAMAQRLESLGCPSDKLVIQPIPIEMRLLSFRSPRVDPTPIVLLQACRFVEKKGVDLTIRAFAQLAAEHPDVVLRLVGDGPEAEALRALARTTGVAHRITFLGMRTHEAYASDLAGADVFVQPSRTGSDGDGEGGAPTTLLEAQAVGLPVVASLHADIPWIVDPQAAILVPEGDADALADGLRTIVRHPEEWSARARAGRRHVERRHAADAAVARLEGVYDDILDRRERGDA